MPARPPLTLRLYRWLSDGRFHSGQALAARCGVSRNAVWKAVAALRTLGVDVHAVPNRGYRLPGATPLLERARILRQLPRALAGRLRSGQCLWRTGSTNSDLMLRPPVPVGQFDFLTAEYQSAGRGRRARSWLSPPGGAICLSIGWCFAGVPLQISALSLAVGVCVLRALRELSLPQLAVKWPNDIVAGTAKLGGILIELRAEAGGPACVVIGVGLNVALGEPVRQQVQASGTRATDLDALGVGRPDRNRIAAALIACIVGGLQQFEREGFAAFAPEWQAADALAGREVVISTNGGSIAGHARGIDADGALCVQTRDGIARFVTGDVSVRPT